MTTHSMTIKIFRKLNQTKVFKPVKQTLLLEKFSFNFYIFSCDSHIRTHTQASDVSVVVQENILPQNLRQKGVGLRPTVAMETEINESYITDVSMQFL